MVQSKSLSPYIRIKIREDRKKINALRRNKAMAQIGRSRYGDLFEDLEGEDFEVRGYFLG